MLRPVESGYSPGAVRDQFQLEAASREPSRGGCGRQVPAGRRSRSRRRSRLAPPRSGGCPSTTERRPGSRRGQPSSGPGAARPAAAVAGARPAPLTRTSGPGRRRRARDRAASPSPRWCRWSRPGQGYGGNRARRLRWSAPGQRAGLAGRPAAAPRPPTRAMRGRRVRPGRRGRATEAPVSRVGRARPASRGRMPIPALSQVAPPPPAAQQDAGGSPGYLRRAVRRLPLRRGAVRARGGPGVRRVGGPRRARALAGSRACQEAPDAV